MQEPAGGVSVQDGQTGAAGTPPTAGKRGWLRDLGLLLLLVLLAGGIRAWHLRHTEVISRDTVGFIRFACQLRESPGDWRSVLRNNLHPPLYPLSVLGMSYAVRPFVAGPETAVMQLSAQLAASLAGVLLVIPLFYLGRSLFDRGVGFWAAALFQCLPYAGRAMSDGLSEALFLLSMATALLLAVGAVRSGSAVRFALAGACGGLAYLTRPEGVLVVAAAGLVLLGVQAVAAWRRPWRQTLACAAGLTLAAAAVGGPYVAAIGKLTNKTTGQVLIGQEARATPKGEEADRNAVRTHAPAARRTTAAVRPAMAGLLAFWSEDYIQGPFTGRLRWGLKAMALELVKGFHYVLWLPALLGLWWFRGRLFPSFYPDGKGDHGAGWVPPVLCALYLLVLLRLTVVMGYLSDRHILLLVLCTSPWAAAAARDIPRRLASWPAARTLLATPGRRRLAEVGLLLAFTVYGLPSTLRPLHTNRAGHRAAGLWLAEHAGQGDVVLDPFCWAEYYAGKAFLHETGFPLLGNYKPNYVVLAGVTATDHVRLRLIGPAELFKSRGRLVYHWQSPKARLKAEPVDVYYIPPDVPPVGKLASAAAPAKAQATP